jgi:hypothetical protein
MIIIMQIAKGIQWGGQYHAVLCTNWACSSFVWGKLTQVPTCMHDVYMQFVCMHR